MLHNAWLVIFESPKPYSTITRITHPIHRHRRYCRKVQRALQSRPFLLDSHCGRTNRASLQIAGPFSLRSSTRRQCFDKLSNRLRDRKKLYPPTPLHSFASAQPFRWCGAYLYKSCWHLLCLWQGRHRSYLPNGGIGKASYTSVLFGIRG